MNAPNPPSTIAPQVAGASDSPLNLRDKVRALQLPSTQQRANRSNLKWIVALVFFVSAVWFSYSRGWINFGSNLSGASQPATAAKPPSENSASEKPATTTSPVNETASKPVASPSSEKKNSISRDGIALESNGYFMPARKILVSPKVSGMLMSFNLQEGQRVQKGQVLGVIESVEYESDLHRAEATRDLAKQRLRELENGFRAEEIEQAQAELAETEANLKKSEADYARGRDLLQKNSFTQSEFDQVVATYQGLKRRAERLKAALKLMELGPREERKSQAKAEVAQSEADVAKAQWRLDNCKIRSPISGTILTKNAEEGNIVNPIAMNGSFSLCDLADLADLEVDLKIQERDVARIFAGQKCKVRAIAYPDRIYEGVVDRLMPIADRSKGAVPIRVKVTVPSDEEGVYLKPDMGAIVSFYAKGN